MSKVRIVNWLLTRRCNLHCDYCAIVKNYKNMPSEYPRMNYYKNNEMTTDMITNCLLKLKKHNPNIFNIFYGGEPLLRKDLADIVNFCNKNNIFYTIISNNTNEIQPLITKLFEKTDYIEGFTSSVDPINILVEDDTDRMKKSLEGFTRLKEMQIKGKVKDVVAEITVMKNNIGGLHPLIKRLSYEGIYSDVTFVDITKNKYYDFSNISDVNQLVFPNWDLAVSLIDIYNESLLVHMDDVLFPAMFDTLPSNMNCHLEDGIHNLSIDSDGTIRLCLRIRGIKTPSTFNIKNLFDEKNPEMLNENLQKCISYDKYKYCELCNHSCLIMSKYIDDTESGENSLIHSDKRG